MRTTVTDDDEGKEVVRGTDTVGRVVEVSHGTAHVDPDPGLTETVLSKLGWADRDEDTYPLQEEAIDHVADDEIRLKPGL
jgi:hypothetical protein